MFKQFFPKPQSSSAEEPDKALNNIEDISTQWNEDEPLKKFSVRVAVYDSLTTAPRVFDLSSDNFTVLVEQITAQVYTLCHEKGGSVPYTVLREAVENLIHADFKNAVITVMPDGNTVRISDHGPGINDKIRVFLPGFTTATEETRKLIKGVGSGLPIVNESLKLMGGSVTIEDNLKQGSVITLSMKNSQNQTKQHIPEEPVTQQSGKYEDEIQIPENSNIQSKSEQNKVNSVISISSDTSDDRENEQNFMTDEEIDSELSTRQKKVFLLIAEMGEIGPSTVTKELEISLSTAYRDLVTLEELGLVSSIDGGKRKLTDIGIRYLSFIFK